MPLPIILGIAAAAAGVGGIGLGVNGGVKMKKANDKLKEAKNRNEFNNNQLNTANQSCCVAMDVLGKSIERARTSFGRSLSPQPRQRRRRRRDGAPFVLYARHLEICMGFVTFDTVSIDQLHLS